MDQLVAIIPDVLQRELIRLLPVSLGVLARENPLDPAWSGLDPRIVLAAGRMTLKQLERNILGSSK